MKTEVIQIFDENDKNLLKVPLPDNPCNGCRMVADCCGCPSANAYREAIQPYKDANIFEIAQKLKRRNELHEKIFQYNKELEELNALLPDFLKIGNIEE